MALEFTQLQAATNDLWNNTNPNDINFTENVLCYILLQKAIKEEFDTYFVKANETVDGGKKIVVPLEYDEANTGAYHKNTVIPVSKVDIVNKAYFGWGGLYASNSLNLDDQVQNSGAEAVVDLAAVYVKNIMKSAWAKIATQMINRTETGAISALITDLFSTTTSTAYGGIAEDDMALWKANVNTDGVAISFEYMQKLMRTPAIGQHSSKRPNVCITTELLKDGYERTLQTQQRFREQKMVEAGFDNIMHKNCPIYADDNLSTGQLMMLNTNYLGIKAHRDYNFTEPEWVAMKESGQPDKIHANTRFQGQLICTHRKAHVLATGVVEPT